MRIISKFKDYYDGCMMYGVDRDRVYVRNTHELDTKLNIYDISTYPFPILRDHIEVIGFCGKLYPFINGSDGYMDHNERKNLIMYGEDIVNYEVEDVTCPRTYRSYNKIQLIKPHKDSWRRKYDNRVKYNQERYDALMNSESLKSIFLEHKIPVFHYTGSKLIANPNLKDLCFFKVKDSVNTFQELEQYISSVLVSDTLVDVPVGDDIVVRDSKGFDKMSFKKEPGQKKRRKTKK